MDANELCEVGAIFAESEEYLICRYSNNDRSLYNLMMDEVYKDTPIQELEDIKNALWKATLSGGSSANFKVIKKESAVYCGDLSIMQLETRTPEIGIHLLETFRNQGIGSKVMQLFVDKLKRELDAEYLFIRILKSNYQSQRLFKKLGAVEIEAEDQSFVAFMRRMMNELGRERLEEIIGKTYEEMCPEIFCYKIDLCEK